MQAPMNTSRQSPGTVTYVPTPTMIPAAMSPSYGQMSPPMSSRVGPNGTPGLPSMYSPNMGAANAAGGPHTPPFPGFEGVMAGGSLAANGDGGMSIYSSAQGKNAWENEGAGIFDPTGQLHSSQKAPNASPASPARFGILNSSQSQSSPVPPFPQASPQGQGQPLNDMGWVDSTQMFSAKRMVETK